MLVPSYAELMDVLNSESDKDDKITSRYTIVIAAAKRARQLIDGDEPMVEGSVDKPISTAVAELHENKIKVVPEGEGTVIISKKDIEALNEKSKNDARSREMDNETPTETEPTEDSTQLEDTLDEDLNEALDDVLENTLDSVSEDKTVENE